MDTAVQTGAVERSKQWRARLAVGRRKPRYTSDRVKKETAVQTGDSRKKEARPRWQ